MTRPRLSESRRCHYCLLEECADRRLQTCTGCSTTVYCSKLCQKHHWQTHKPLCRAVRLVEQYLAEEETQRNKSSGIGKVDYLSAKQGKRLIQLIGKRKMVKCTFEGVPVTALWNTGAQATVINDKWRAEHLPKSTIRAIDELLGPVPLNGLAANQTEIPFMGWIPVEFKLSESDTASASLLVPVLVSSDPNVAENPIIGFNVIEEVINEQLKQQQNATANDSTTGMVSSAFDIDAGTAKTFIQIMHAHQSSNEGITVRTGKSKVVLHPGEATTVKCRTHTQTEKDMVMLFCPKMDTDLPEGLQIQEVLFTMKRGNTSTVPVSVINTTGHSITLSPRVSLGHIESVKAVYPAAVQPMVQAQASPDKVKLRETDSSDTMSHYWYRNLGQSCSIRPLNW